MQRGVELPRFQVLLLETDEAWVAQGIEHDIAVEASTLADVLYEFERAMVGHFYMSVYRGELPFAHVPPAPPDCAELWKSGIGVVIDTPAFRLVSESDESPPPTPDYRIAASTVRTNVNFEPEYCS